MFPLVFYWVAVGCVLVVFGCVGCFGSFVFILCCEVEVSASLGEFVFLFQVASVFQSCSARPECLSFLNFFFLVI